MGYKASVFSQVMQLIPKLEFQKFVNRHNGDHHVRKLHCWSWFGGLIFGQLTGHNGVRAIVKSFQVDRPGLKMLGFEPIKKSTFADANESRPVDILKDVFYMLLEKAQRFAPKSKFRFKGHILAIDSTTVSLCLSLCPWAQFHHGQGGVKLHTAIDIAGDLPQFAIITKGKVHDLRAIRQKRFSEGTTLVVDKAYVDYSWFNNLTANGVWFVTRMKNNCQYSISECRETNRTQGAICDQTIVLSSLKGQEYEGKLRKIGYKDLESGKRYTFITNRFDLSPKTIADLYKARWKIELFFKTLKGQLRITKLLGTSVNSFKAQVWAALIAYLLIMIIRCQTKLNWSIPETMAVIGVMIFIRESLERLLRDAPVKRLDRLALDQLSFW